MKVWNTGMLELRKKDVLEVMNAGDRVALQLWDCWEVSEQPVSPHHQVFLQLSHSLGPGTRVASAAEIACPLEHVDERELSSKEARETIQRT